MQKDSLHEPAPTRPITAKDYNVFRIVNLRPGGKLLIEVEPLQQSDRDCISANLTVNDGPNHQAFTDIVFKINSVTLIDESALDPK